MATIYCMGICGTGMASLAGLLKDLGHQVIGSDKDVYPPMSEKLRQWQIDVLVGFNSEHLSHCPLHPIDWLIIGNVIRASNPEAIYARQNGYKTLSMPEALARFALLNKHSIVVTGTHGKTTTTAMLSHVLTSQGYDPSFLVGGVMQGYDASFRNGQGQHFVIEGDEYDTAYFDKQSKFLHYQPQTAIVTSLEYDHADIFADIAAVEDAFFQFMQKIPATGQLIVWAGAQRALKLYKQLPFQIPLIRYHHLPLASWQEEDSDLKQMVQQNRALIDYGVQSFYYDHQGLCMTLQVHHHLNDHKEEMTLRLPVWGDFSIQNSLAAIAALRTQKMSWQQIQQGFQSFQGVKKRLEIIGQKSGITIVEDFAHHPTAVLQTLQAARLRFQDARIWAIFEPRSATSRRNIFQQAYIEAFQKADAVIIAYHQRLHEVIEGQRFSPEQVSQALRQQGLFAEVGYDVGAIVLLLQKKLVTGDVVLLFSNGDFDGLSQRLLQILA